MEVFFSVLFFFLQSKQRSFVNMHRSRGREGESAWMKEGTVCQVHMVKTMNDDENKGRLVISLFLNINVGEEDILLAES